MHKEKILSLLLAVVMLFSLMMPISVSAEEIYYEDFYEEPIDSFIEDTYFDEEYSTEEYSVDENSEDEYIEDTYFESPIEEEPEEIKIEEFSFTLEDQTAYAAAGIAVITSDPENASGNVGDTVTFSVTADNAVSYQWQYSDNGGTSYRNTGLTGFDTDTLTVYLKTKYYLGYYWRCIVTGPDGKQVTSKAATTEANIVEGDFIFELIGDSATDVRIVAYMGTSASIVNVPTTVVNGQYIVKEIGVGDNGLGVFENHSEIMEVSLPNSIEVIGQRAFKNCSNLSKMTCHD